VPWIGVGHENLRSRASPRNPLKHTKGPGGDTGAKTPFIADMNQ
jgi:hypothetical protein